jgi:hypothetical protein
MLTFSRIFKIKEGKLDVFKNWMNELSTTRRDEAIATFDYENVTREVFAVFKGKDGEDYVVAFNEGGDIPGPSDPNVPINKQHNLIKQECLESFSDRGEIVMDLSK